MADVKVYGADWCSDTRHALSFLDEQGIDYEYINIEHDRSAAKWVMDHNDGKEKKPTLDVKGQVLSNPSKSELSQVLQAQGLAR